MQKCLLFVDIIKKITEIEMNLPCEKVSAHSRQYTELTLTRSRLRTTNKTL